TGCDRGSIHGPAKVFMKSRANIYAATEHFRNSRDEIGGRAALEHKAGNAGSHHLAHDRRLIVDAEAKQAQLRMTLQQPPGDVSSSLAGQRQAQHHRIRLKAAIASTRDRSSASIRTVSNKASCKVWTPPSIPKWLSATSTRPNFTAQPFR